MNSYFSAYAQLAESARKGLSQLASVVVDTAAARRAGSFLSPRTPCSMGRRPPLVASPLSAPALAFPSVRLAAAAAAGHTHTAQVSKWRGKEGEKSDSRTIGTRSLPAAEAELASWLRRCFRPICREYDRKKEGRKDGHMRRRHVAVTRFYASLVNTKGPTNGVGRKRNDRLVLVTNSVNTFKVHVRHQTMR